jgi:hypothetical protein
MQEESDQEEGRRRCGDRRRQEAEPWGGAQGGLQQLAGQSVNDLPLLTGLEGKRAGSEASDGLGELLKLAVAGRAGGQVGVEALLGIGIEVGIDSRRQVALEPLAPVAHLWR